MRGYVRRGGTASTRSSIKGSTRSLVVNGAAGILLAPIATGQSTSPLSSPLNKVRTSGAAPDRSARGFDADMLADVRSLVVVREQVHDLLVPLIERRVRVVAIEGRVSSR